MNEEITMTPVAPGEANGVMPEFGRHRQVFELFGIKRGLLHLLVTEGKIKSVLIRRKGNVHGTRYYHLASVSAYLHAQMEEQENTQNLADSAGSESVHNQRTSRLTKRPVVDRNPPDNWQNMQNV